MLQQLLKYLSSEKGGAQASHFSYQDLIGVSIPNFIVSSFGAWHDYLLEQGIAWGSPLRQGEVLEFNLNTEPQ